jgi:hypothetical protein
VVGDQLGGAHLLLAELGVLVDVAPPGDHLGLDRCDLCVDDRGGDGLGLGGTGEKRRARGGGEELNQTGHPNLTEHERAMFNGSGPGASGLGRARAGVLNAPLAHFESRRCPRPSPP